MKKIRSMIARHSGRAGLLGVAAVGAIAFGIYWFGPQYLFIDRAVDEGLPTGPVASGGPVAEGGGTSAATDATPEATAEPVVLAAGEFRSLAHDASGRALILELLDGSLILRFEDLNVSNGPDLKVYLSAAPSSSGGSAFDDDFVELGALKGNIGNQNYAIPAGVDLSRYRSAVVWCKRFSVGFAVAPVEVPAG